MDNLNIYTSQCVPLATIVELVITDWHRVFFQLTMRNSTKLLLFFVLVVPNILTSETRRRHGGKPTQDELRAFKRCKSKVCAARVSFCIIMKDCQRCRPRAPGEKCECCEDCFRCLGGLWRKCCDCIGLCSYFSPPNGTSKGQEIPSSFGDLDTSLPTLFEAMSHGSRFPIAFMTRPRQPTPLSPTVGKKGMFWRSSRSFSLCFKSYLAVYPRF